MALLNGLRSLSISNKGDSFLSVCLAKVVGKKIKRVAKATTEKLKIFNEELQKRNNIAELYINALKDKYELQIPRKVGLEAASATGSVPNITSEEYEYRN